MMSEKEKQQAITLAKQGSGPTAIARQLGLSLGATCSLLYRARKAGEAIPKFRATPGTWGGVRFNRVVIPETIYAQFQEAALERGVKPAYLIRDVLAHIAQDDLFDAVLDQEE